MSFVYSSSKRTRIQASPRFKKKRQLSGNSNRSAVKAVAVNHSCHNIGILLAVGKRVSLSQAKYLSDALFPSIAVGT